MAKVARTKKKVLQTLKVSNNTNGFQETEIGYVPVHWRVVQLRDIAKLKDGDWILNEHYTASGVRLLQVGDVGVGGFVNKSNRFISMESANQLKCTFITPKNILISRMADPVGRACHAPELSYPAITAVDVSIATPNKDVVDSDFMVLALNSPLNFEQCAKLATGVTRQRVSRRNLETVRLPLPPLPEQQWIAHVLSTIQRAIAAQDAVIAAAREVKRSLMHRLFTYGPYADPLPTKETEFGDVPAEWTIVPLAQCAYVQTGATKGRKFKGQLTIEVPYLRVENVQDGYLDLTEIKRLRIKESELDRYGLQNGDVVLTEGGDFDKLGRGFIWHGQIEPCIHQNHIFAVRTDRSVLLPEFLAYLVQSSYGKRYFLKVAHRTTHLASINSTKLKALPVLLAPLSEQEAMAHQLEQADRKIAAEESRQVALRALFKSMLHQLMTGRIRAR